MTAPNREDDAVEYEDEIECPVCQGFGFLEREDEGTIECDECGGNGTVAP